MEYEILLSVPYIRTDKHIQQQWDEIHSYLAGAFRDYHCDVTKDSKLYGGFRDYTFFVNVKDEADFEESLTMFIAYFDFSKIKLDYWKL